MELPGIIEGGKHSDDRGNLFFNRNFDASEIKRIYFIENKDIHFVRGWTGHKIEQRWFTASHGSFIIKLVTLEDFEKSKKEPQIFEFELNSKKLDIIHIPKGYATAIQSKETDSKLLVMADYRLGEINDDYRYPLDYFENL
ncbi:dTDP-4-dehydrorhamnose 3,5-epimerase [Chryseobacterium soldanellicola]|uniref:dTDP-4-dehydrorhamnose 3,5-epimerase n=1 Tax=Chryseobacterium soldanellicola TaxID=311333 RepID=A0A1H1DA82_9FLAO|nr:WxcM-like domain-containing protein [Chryseobacterium soldanellicola]SDQ73310.1 dTDP-4-dehydrorhamnose 3,5-epimerase [Chryseobacterium soldanellicola]